MGKGRLLIRVTKGEGAWSVRTIRNDWVRILIVPEKKLDQGDGRELMGIHYQTENVTPGVRGR